MFDWITWGVWGLGFAIMVIWVIVPIREFRAMLQHRRKAEGKATKAVAQLEESQS